MSQVRSWQPRQQADDILIFRSAHSYNYSLSVVINDEAYAIVKGNHQTFT